MADAAGRSGSGNELQRNAKLMGTAPYGGGGERLCPGRTSGGATGASIFSRADA